MPRAASGVEASHRAAKAEKELAKATASGDAAAAALATARADLAALLIRFDDCRAALEDKVGGWGVRAWRSATACPRHRHTDRRAC